MAAKRARKPAKKITVAQKKQAMKALKEMEKMHGQLALHIRKHRKQLKAMDFEFNGIG